MIETSSAAVETLAIIPARGGSKGLPRKALKTIGGITLLERSVRASLNARSTRRTIVSTDDAEYAAVARAAGAEVPFLRPPELSGDTARVTDAVEHLLTRLKADSGYNPEFIALLQPTTPLTIGADIDGAFAAIGDADDAAVSVCLTEVMPDWLRVADDNGYLRPLGQLDVPRHTPRQAMRPVYRLNGAIYWVRTRVFLEGHSFLPPKTRFFPMPQERSIDIDNAFDLSLAEFIHQHYRDERESETAP